MPTPRKYANPAQRQAAYRQRVAEARRQELQAKGLPPLPAIATLPGEVRWRSLIRQSLGLLHTLEEEMRDYHDQRSETWQESERGERFRDRLSALEELQEAAEELPF